MENITLKLRGKDADGNERYRSYFIVTDGGRMVGTGRASVIPMSKGVPMPQEDHVVVKQGGEEEAAARLIKTLLALPGNEGLVAEMDDNPT